MSSPPSFPFDALSELSVKPAEITLPVGSACEFDLCRILRSADGKRKATLAEKYPQGVPAFDYETPPAVDDGSHYRTVGVEAAIVELNPQLQQLRDGGDAF